jgi:hypothetical protein
MTPQWNFGVALASSLASNRDRIQSLNYSNPVAVAEVLMLVARSGPTMMARIGLLKALNRHVERVFNPERKDIHWGNGSSREINDRLGPAGGLVELRLKAKE